MAIVFFDFDGTLTKCDTLVPYCLIALLHRPWRIFYITQVLRASKSFYNGKLNRQELKEAFLSAFLRSADKTDVSRWNSVFFRLVLPIIKHKKMLEKISHYKQKGDKVFIVSASPDIYLSPLVTQWSLDGLICTELEWKNGCLTGLILGKNCRGEEKARRIQVLFSENKQEGSIAYGNSSGDQELLGIVNLGIKI